MELGNGQIDSRLFCRSIAKHKRLVNDPYFSSAIVPVVMLLSKRLAGNLLLAKATFAGFDRKFQRKERPSNTVNRSTKAR